VHNSTFRYGAFINAVISFLLIAAALYFVVVMPLNKIAERRAARVEQGEPDPEPKPEDIILLEQIRDLLAQSNGKVTSAKTATTPSQPAP
jgi:large conductance mechanosensitive channel